MNLNRVLEGVPLVSSAPAQLLERDVFGLAYDSRKVDRGFLFFAFAGAKADGVQFANAAMQKRALAVVSDRPSPAGFQGTWIQVPHAPQALASASRNFYENPDQRLALTGITGTNGKTTSTSLIDAMLRAAGKTTALIGTIEYHLAGRVLPAVNTTPESLDLFRMFHDLEQMGGTHATLEASSHALDLGRIYAMEFHTAGFTNFTRDHLDYHHTMEAYFAAKQLLFTPRTSAPPRFAVLNADDDWGRRLMLSSETAAWWYGIEQEPPGGNNPLLRMDKVILTAHVASATARFDPARRRRVGLELSLVLSGKWPMSCVNPAVLAESGLARWQPVSMERGPNS